MNMEWLSIYLDLFIFFHRSFVNLLYILCFIHAYVVNINIIVFLNSICALLFYKKTIDICISTLHPSTLIMGEEAGEI